MKQTDIEILPDGRVALILHNGKFDKPLSTYELKRAALRAYFGALVDRILLIKDLRRDPDRWGELDEVADHATASLELK
jgi:hypothetical protein